MNCLRSLATSANYHLWFEINENVHSVWIIYNWLSPRSETTFWESRVGHCSNYLSTRLNYRERYWRIVIREICVFCGCVFVAPKSVCGSNSPLNEMREQSTAQSARRIIEKRRIIFQMSTRGRWIRWRGSFNYSTKLIYAQVFRISQIHMNTCNHISVYIFFLCGFSYSTRQQPSIMKAQTEAIDSPVAFDVKKPMLPN